MINTTKKPLGASFLSTEFEHQSLMITVPFDYKETVSPQSSLPDLSQHNTPFTEVMNSSHGWSASLNVEREIQGASGSALSTVQNDSKDGQKYTIFEPDFLKSSKRKHNIFNNPSFSTSNVMPPTLKPSRERGLPGLLMIP